MIMPFKYHWYIEGQIIYAELWGDQTLEELHTSNNEMIANLEQSNGRFIHVIINDAKLLSIPLSLPKIQKVLTYTKHPNLGWAVMIGEKEKGLKDSVQDFMIIMIAKLARARYIRLKTFEDALSHLHKVDQTIEWDTVDSDLRATLQKKQV